MVTLVSVLVFVGFLAGMWVWVGYQRRHAHVKKRQR